MAFGPYELIIDGVTSVAGINGIGRHGHLRAAMIFELTDRPVAVAGPAAFIGTESALASILAIASQIDQPGATQLNAALFDSLVLKRPPVSAALVLG